MATLAEYQKLSMDVLLSGIYENILTADELIPWLQFKSVQGNSLKHNRETTLPTATTFALGSELTDTDGTVTTTTTSLAQVYQQFSVDRFALATLSDIQSQEAARIAMSSKAMGRKLADLFINGDSAVSSTEFNGLEKLVRGDTRMMAMDDGVVDGPGAAETELTLDRLDSMIDQVERGRPDALVMNKRMRRKLTSLMRAAGSGVVLDSIEMFGRRVELYDTIPIVINDFISNAEQYADASTWPSSTATTIYAVKFGEVNQGLEIIHNGSVLTPEIQRIGILESENKNRYRLVVYVAMIAYSKLMYAALGGIDANS